MGSTSAATLERLYEVAASTEVAGMPTPHEEIPNDPLWRVWPGRDWPASGVEEGAFLADLQLRADGAASSKGIAHRRGDTTAVLNALRCGLDAPDLLGRAPGLRPDRLLAAHSDLDGRRRDAVAAWRGIVSTPTAESVVTWGGVAAALVPVVIGRLRDVRPTDGAELESVIAACAADIDRVGRLAASVERDMSDPTVPARRRTGLAALLFAGAGSGLWYHECYLAHRVGSLVPVRVAALLGENTAR
jgi:hypothetical protein